MRAIILGLCVAIAAPAAAFAQSYQAVNRLTVVPLGGSNFEVIEARGEGARGIWCAAAEYADTRLRMGRTDRLYVKSPRGASQSGAGRIGVVFTTNAKTVTPTSSYSVSVRQAGQSLPVNHAIQFCKDYQIELEDNILFRRTSP